MPARSKYPYHARDPATYNAWAGMKQRCDNEKHPRYADYGGRGITYDPRWATFSSFLEDMGICPPGRSLERENNDKGYSQGNCCWADSFDQAQNKRRYRNNTTGYTGVSLSPRGKYQANAQRNGVRKTIGYFDTPEQAKEARNKWLSQG